MTLKRKLRVLPLAAILVLGVSGCGKKLPPQAPLQVIPARVEPLRLAQEGADVVIRFPYPSLTAQGESLTDLRKVTVYRELIPARAGAVPPPPPSDSAAREREEKRFKGAATPLRELRRGDLDDATVGAEIVLFDSLLPLYSQGQIGRVFLRYGVTATRDRNRTSELSPLVTILPLVPPDRPLALTAAVEEKRVCLDWLRPIAMLDGERTKVNVAGYVVYRREEKEEAYGSPIGVVLRGEAYIDETIQTAKRYLYTVRAAPTKNEPLVLGPAADELLVDTRDVFAPPVPEGLLALAEEGANRLLWNPVLVADLAGYRVYRKDEPEGAFRRIAEKLKDPTYVDVKAPAHVRYAVTAVDLSGNESGFSLTQPSGPEPENP